MMNTVSEEQRKRIEEKRRRALEKRTLKSGFVAQDNNQILPVINNSSSHVNFHDNATTGSSSMALSMPLFPIKNTSFKKIATNVTNNAMPSFAANILPQPITNNVPNNSKVGFKRRFQGRMIGEYFKRRAIERNLSGGHFQRHSRGGYFQRRLKEGRFQKHSEETLKGHCVLLNHKRFCVNVGFHKDTVEIFRSVPSGQFDTQTKKWNFSIADHDKLISVVEPLQPNILIIPLPHFLLELFNGTEERNQIKEYDLSHMDQTLVNALLPFQKIGLYFGIQHGGRVLLADDMGLGKTIQGIAIANYFIKDWPLLVVTPSSVRYSWLHEFQTWLPTVEAHEISVINSSKDHIPNVKVVIMSYDLLAKMQSNIINRKFRTVIFDESHFLKNHKAYRTKAAQAIMKSMVRIIMLSGTPALSRPIELFTQISALCPEYFYSFNEYGKRYCNGKQRGSRGWRDKEFYGASNLEELQLVLEELVMIRRLKSDVLSQLPAKTRQMVILDPSRISSRKSKTLKAVFVKMRKSESGRRNALREYFTKTASLKIPAICDYILDLLESDRKFLCFAHHQEVMSSICSAIARKNVDYICINGSVPSEERKKLCDYFQSNDACKVAVLSITAACCGITLTAASLVVFAELYWNPGVLTQAEDRAHRIGQEDHVVIQYLIAKGTADDEMWSLVQKKLDVLNKAGLSKDNFKFVDTIFKDDSSELVEDFLEELSESDNSDTDLIFDVPEKCLKLSESDNSDTDLIFDVPEKCLKLSESDNSDTDLIFDVPENCLKLSESDNSDTDLIIGAPEKCLKLDL